MHADVHGSRHNPHASHNVGGNNPTRYCAVANLNMQDRSMKRAAVDHDAAPGRLGVANTNSAGD
jgi:hypothetical protein